MNQAGDIQNIQGSGAGRQPIAWVLDVSSGILCAIAAVGIASFALLINRRFFYIDDYQTYFMPAVREIARLIQAGQLPFITDRLWQGGALLPEYQAAVLNPVSVSLYLLMSHMSDPAIAAAFFSLSHIALFASGTYFLCRTLGCEVRHSLVAGLVAPTSDWIMYWGAANWVLALVSIGWMTWAAGMLIRSYSDEKWLIPAILAVALFFTCGWPFGIVAWLIASLIVFLWMFARPGRFVTWPNLRPWLAMMAGGLMAAPAILPMFPYLAFSERPLDPGKWASNLASLSAVGLPFYATEWRGFWSRVEFVKIPMIYVAWFVPLVLANADWRKLWRGPVERVILILILSFAFLSMLPHMGQFRWMFRLLPYYNLLLVVLVALIFTRQRGDEIRWTYFPTALALSFPVVLSIGQVPAAWLLYVSSGLLVLLLVAVSLALRANRTAWLAYALASQIAIVWAVNAVYVRADYPSFPNAWSVPFQLVDHKETEPLRRRLALFEPARDEDPGADFWRDFMPASTSLFSDTISVNGYSPYHSKSYRKNFCFVHLAAVACRDIVSRLVKHIEPTGHNLLDLMRIDEVVVQDPKIAEQLLLLADGNWASSTLPTGTTVLRRSLDGESPPDPVSWQSEGVRTSMISHSPQQIVMDVRNNSGRATTIVLARAWYPGWSATMDGQPLKVVPLHGLMVSVEVPPDTAGRLTLVYWPDNFWLGMWIAALGLAMAIAMLLKILVFYKPSASFQGMQQ